MSDKMRPIPFTTLLKQTITEYRQKGTMFYVPVTRIDKDSKVLIHGKWIESPIGPAAGPHTQLAQNIIAAYAAGARYFELKTVQILDGEELGIKKPCIYVKDEAYNTEWSTELTAYQALDEYIKAWVVLKIISKEFNIGDPEGFTFNMSVGYNLEGIQSEKIDTFIEMMKDVITSRIFQQYIHDVKESLWNFSNISPEYVDSISPNICNTVTLSTMHGCPADEIESITSYLLTEKRLNTYLKCNPTILGYKEVRSILDEMGYDYVTFDAHYFEQDLDLDHAVLLIKRLQSLASKNKLEFGIKLTNTFPVKINHGELLGDSMYMSGAPLYPLAIGVAAKLVSAVGKDLKVSYSGGADVNNIGAIYETGIHPITVSTLLLKPAGYNNLTKLNRAIQDRGLKSSNEIDIDKLQRLAKEAIEDKKYYKPEKKAKKSLQNKGYTSYCSFCKNCVDTCPNRANESIMIDTEKFIIHKDWLCNECGNCAHFCIMGRIPYREKFTIYESITDYKDSKNPGFYKFYNKNELYIRINDKEYTELNGIEDLMIHKIVKWY